MRNSSLLAEAATLLLKSQAEFNRLADKFSTIISSEVYGRDAASDHHFAIGRNGLRLSGRLQNDVLELTAQHKDMAYTATLPTRGKSLSELTATVTLAGDGESKTFTLNGEEFFKGTGITAEFAELHAKVTNYVLRTFPWLKTAAKTEATQPSAPTGGEGTTATEEKAPVEQEVLLSRDNGKPLKFVGKLLGSVQSPLHHGRYWEFGVYQTRGGKFIAVKIGHSLWVSECDRVEAEVLDSQEAVYAFLGETPLAKALYARIGFDYYELVD